MVTNLRFYPGSYFHDSYDSYCITGWRPAWPLSTTCYTQSTLPPLVLWALNAISHQFFASYCFISWGKKGGQGHHHSKRDFVSKFAGKNFRHHQDFEEPKLCYTDKTLMFPSLFLILFHHSTSLKQITQAILLQQWVQYCFEDTEHVVSAMRLHFQSLCSSFHIYSTRTRSHT